MLIVALASPLGVRADTTVFLSDDASFADLDVLVDATPGTSGAFDVWVRAGVQIAGISLDVVVTSGSSIELTAAELVTPPDRWVITPSANVTPTAVTSIDGGAFVGLSGNGIGPDSTSSDAEYDAGLDAFRFARVSYEVVGTGVTELALRIGGNIIGFVSGSDPIFLGVGDGPVAALAGETGQFIDGRIETGICPAAPAPDCIAARKANVSISYKKPGGEKLKAKLSKLAADTVQGDFGDPVTGDSAYSLCLYDAVGMLAGALRIDRAGQDCGPKAKPCWEDKRGRAWSYKDPDAEEDGARKVALTSGPAGKGKLTWQAGNKIGKGQLDFPPGITGALEDATSATVQVSTSDGACVEAQLGTVKRAEELLFKAKAP